MRNRRLTVAIGLLALLLAPSIRPAYADGDTEKQPGRDRRFDTLEELLAVAPPPPAAQSLANQLMDDFEHDPDLGDVIIVGDREIVVALKSATSESRKVNGMTVTIISSPISLAEFDEISSKVAHLDSGVHEASFDFLTATMTVLTSGTPDSALTAIRELRLPEGVNVEAVNAPPVTLEAAEGAMNSDASGCTTGFRVRHGSPPSPYLTSANHSSCSNWSTVNGVSMTHQLGFCSVDMSLASGSPTALSLGGIPFSGVQGNPAYGALVYKYGVTSGWDYAHRGSVANSTLACTVPVYNYPLMPHAGGDSGGPYITLSGACPFCSYEARGTHRGFSGLNSHGVRMGSINNLGIYVG